MFSYKAEIMENGKWTALKGWVMPFSDGASLDEGLDSGKLNLSMCERRDALRPFTRVRISVYEGDSASGTPVEIIERVVMSDVVKMRRVGTE